MSHDHSQSPSRAGTPSDCVGRGSFLNIAEDEQQSLTSFHTFGYENHLDPFNLAVVPAGARVDAGTNHVYDSSATVQHSTHFPGGGPQPIYHSPSNSPSSPDPHYGDFNPFPLSPPHTGGPLLSFIDQQNHPHQPGFGPAHHQPLSPIHLSSPLHQTSFDTSRSSTFQSTSQTHHQRRDYSNLPDRRHSSVSTTPLRSFQPSSAFSGYGHLASSGATTQSSCLYGPSMIPEGASRPNNLYVNTSRTTGSSSSGIDSPSSMMPRRPAVGIAGQNSSMGPPLPPPAKTGTRQYRKKTPPEACVICRHTQTPEWRKGPSGLRTLCNACGLTAAKLSNPEPTTLDEVYQQLTEVGLNRFRGQFCLAEDQKSMAAQSWATQTSNSNRNTHPSRSRIPPGYHNSPLKISPRNTTKSRAPHRNPADMDAAQQLFSMSRGRENNLRVSILHNTPPPSSLGLGNHYGSPSSPHPDSLEINDSFQHMTCTTADFSGLSPTLAMMSSCSPNGLNSAHYPASPLLSPGEQHSHHALGLYPPASVTSSGHSTRGRRNSIGGHRMSISSIINQDPPSRPASGINSDTRLHHLQQHHAQNMDSLLSQHPSQVEYPKGI